MKRTTQAILALFLVTICWGLTFPLIHTAVESISPAEFVLLRLAIGLLVFLPFVAGSWRQTTYLLLIDGLILGLLNSSTYVFQTIGLQTISSSNSAFLTATCVVMVPFLAPLFRMGRLRLVDMLAGAVTLCGIFVLTGAHFSGFSVGDLWTLGGAVGYAFCILYLQAASQRGYPVGLLVFYQMLGAIVLPMGMLSSASFTFHFTASVWVAIAFCGVVATALTFYLQNAFQKYMSASKAALIYAFEPVFATIFAFWLGGEPITVHCVLGGSLVMSGFLVSQVLSQWLYRPVAQKTVANQI